MCGRGLRGFGSRMLVGFCSGGFSANALSLSMIFHSVSMRSLAVATRLRFFVYTPPIYSINMVVRVIVFHSPQVFCEMRMPVIVPAKPVMAAKTSLFHVRSNARCAISSAVRLKVKAMANLTPRTRRSLGGTSSATLAAVLSVVFRRERFLNPVCQWFRTLCCLKQRLKQVFPFFIFSFTKKLFSKSFASSASTWLLAMTVAFVVHGTGTAV